MTEATIFNIQRFSTEDGPGIRTTVFFKGCPLSCVWCHNPEGINVKRELMWYDVRCIGARDCIGACPEEALVLTKEGMKIDRGRCTSCGKCEEACPAAAIEVIGKKYTADEVFKEIYKDEAFYRNSGGGVTLGGGDPIMQSAAAREILELSKEAGISTAIDTCGAFSSGAYNGITKHVDLFLFDLKLMDDTLHKKATGRGLSQILENAEIIGKGKIPIWVRTPIIPGWTDNDDNIRKIARFIKEKMPAAVRYDLLTFNNLCADKYRRLDISFSLVKTPLLEKAKMERLAEIAKKEGAPDVHWSGATRLPDEKQMG